MVPCWLRDSAEPVGSLLVATGTTGTTGDGRPVVLLAPPVRLCPGEGLLRERPVDMIISWLVHFLDHDHIMVCHCLSFQLNHDDSACHAEPVTPWI